MINGWYLYSIVIIVCMDIIGCPWSLWLLCVWLIHFGWCILDDVFWSVYCDWCLHSYLMHVWLSIYDWYMVEILWINDQFLYGWCMCKGCCTIDISWCITDFWMISKEYLCFVLRWKLICCYGPFLLLVRLEILHISSLCMLH